MQMSNNLMDKQLHYVDNRELFKIELCNGHKFYYISANVNSTVSILEYNLIAYKSKIKIIREMIKRQDRLIIVISQFIINFTLSMCIRRSLSFSLHSIVKNRSRNWIHNKISLMKIDL